MTKINTQVLLQMVEEKTSRRDMAAWFGCSQGAISRRLKRLMTEPAEPLKINDLTSKEKAFVVAIVSGESQTNAALKAYDVTSRQSAKALGHTLMKNQGIKEALAEIRDREIPLSHLIGKLRKHVDNRDPATSLRAIDMGLKLHNAYPSERKPEEEPKTFIDLSSINNTFIINNNSHGINHDRDMRAPQGKALGCVSPEDQDR